MLGARGLAPYTETRHPVPKAPATMPLSFAFHPRLIDALRGYTTICHRISTPNAEG